MRIRKLSSVVSASSGYGGEIPETYVCHLNQSPWDVISENKDCASELTNIFDSSWFLTSPQCLHDGEEEDSCNENTSLGDSNGNAERLNNRSLAVEDNYERSMDLSVNSEEKFKVVETNSPEKTSDDDEKVDVIMRGPPKRGRPRGTAKKAQGTTKKPYEFYYYSGFGPRWGRKRGGGSGDEKVVIGENEKRCEDYMRSNSSQEEEEEDDKMAAFRGRYSNFDEMEYELMDNQDSEESEEEENESKSEKKMKRCRKPVKERSLKSLM